MGLNTRVFHSVSFEEFTASWTREERWLWVGVFCVRNWSVLTWTAGSGFSRLHRLHSPACPWFVALSCSEAVSDAAVLRGVCPWRCKRFPRQQPLAEGAGDGSITRAGDGTALLSVWDGSCGRTLNGSPVLADLKQGVGMRFLANRVGACRFAQARMYFEGCRGAKDNPPRGRTGAPVSSSDFPLVSLTVA